MNAKMFTPRAYPLVCISFVLALLVSACGLLPQQANVPPVEAYQACTAAPIDNVFVDGQNWPCDEVRAAYATLGAPPVSTSAPGPAAVPAGSLKYDETGGVNLAPGQKQLIATYLRLPAPISQAALEAPVAKIQAEAATAKATVFEGTTLTLDQRVAWLVWCSDATQVDPPADVSLVHEVSLLDPKTLGRVWIQVPFAQGVPLRSDDTWTGCNGQFWAVAVH